MQKILIPFLALLAACSIYRADVQQGNLVSQEMVAQLSLGMDKRTVQKILGTPLLRDGFQRDRWDYFYSLKRDGKLVKQTDLRLRFKDDKLSAIEGTAAE